MLIEEKLAKVDDWPYLITLLVNFFFFDKWSILVNLQLLACVPSYLELLIVHTLPKETLMNRPSLWELRRAILPREHECGMEQISLAREDQAIWTAKRSRGVVEEHLGTQHYE